MDEAIGASARSVANAQEFSRIKEVVSGGRG